MKKLILSMALLAGMTLVACSDDDSKKSNGNCVTCDAFTIQGQTMPEQEVCKGENGNGIVDGEDSGISYEQTIEAMEMMTDCN